MITEYHNYNNGYIALVNVQLPGLPETIEIEGDTLFRKDEFHISLVCVKRLAPLIDPDNVENIQAEMVEHFKQIQKELPLNIYELLPELRVVQRDDRKTLIVLAKVPGVEELFERLRKIFGKDIPTQQTHITLYTLQGGKGIGLISKRDLDASSHIVQVSELAKIMQH